MKKVLFLILSVLLLIATFAAAEANRSIVFAGEDNVVYIGKTLKLDAKIEKTTEDAPKNTAIVWTSSDESIAKVTNNGSVTGVSAGKAIITAAAKDDETIKSTVEVEVRTPVKGIKINEAPVTLTLGGKEKTASTVISVSIEPEDAYHKDVVWSSANEKVAVVDQDGVVAAVGKGSTVITATSSDPSVSQKATCKVTVGQAVTGVEFDSTEYTVLSTKPTQIKATVSPKDAQERKLIWSSSDETVATVNEQGLVTGLSVGEATITAVSADGNEVTASCKVTVVVPVKKITVSDSSVMLAAGTVWRLKAEVEPEDATNKALVWSSSNEKVAMVSDDGFVTGMSKGSANITVSATDGSKSTAVVNVKVDEYHMVFTMPFRQQGSYKYTFQGYISIRGSVKKGNVILSDVDRDISGGVYGGYADGYFNVTPIKAGTDTITIKAGNSRVNYNVFIHPDCFKAQELGFGYGAIVKPGELGVFNGHTYKLVADKCSWNEAKKKCEQTGGHLVTITSEEEQKYIELLNNENKSLWIGLRKANDVWKWVTKEELDYTHWAGGEPNDYGTREYPYENVGVFKPEWNDLHENNMSDVYGYVCEWDEVTIDVEAIEEEGEIIEPESFGNYKDHTYQIIHEKCTWKEAKERCEALGGHLVTVTAPDEQRFIQRLNKSNQNLWIGLRKNNDDSWKWVTGEDFVISAWNSGEPNNYWSREFPYENVAAMSPLWKDYHEKNIADIGGFICEWDHVVSDIEALKKEEQRIEKQSRIKTLKQHKYLIVEDKCSWSEAKEKCEAMGGHLATVVTYDEQYFIEQMLRGEMELWIGMRRGDDDQFYWITGEPIQYTNWGEGEPNNYGDGENSVAMRPNWNDYDENNTWYISGFVCEWEPDATVSID